MSEPLVLPVEPSSPVRMFAAGRFDVERVRADFPILRRNVRGCALTYLDNAATTQKPRQVIDALVDYYENYNANIHRGLHKLAEEAPAVPAPETVEATTEVEETAS